MRNLWMVMFIMVLTGCASMNVQKATLNGSAQVSAALFLDSRPIDKVDGDLKKSKEIVASVKKFIATGNIANLTVGALRQELNKIVPVPYVSYVDAIMSAVAGIKVPVNKIGPNNVERIISVIEGLEIEFKNYDKRHHPQIPL